MAYADPPYVGQARAHYGEDEVDHEALIRRLIQDYPAGWALSASSPSLRLLLPMCPEGIRVMAWIKPFCSWKPNVNPAYAWEPVIVWGGRKRTRFEDTVRDWVAENITIQRGLAGAKPVLFSFWLFEVLNLLPDDEFDDLFPGTGAVTKAWHAWCQIKRDVPPEALEMAL